jgi:N-acyl-D-amino-acid deacylase
MTPNLILRGGIVHDGSGGTFRADVAIAGDRIVAAGPLAADTAAVALDVTGRHVAPGFIDMHSHSDTALIADPRNAAKTRQGITFDLIGQDGLGVAPFDPGRDVEWRRGLLPLTGHPDLAWSWRSIGDHLAAIEAARPATNVGALLAYGSVRNAVMGMADRPPSAAEQAAIESMIEASMPDVFGVSVGLVYPPAAFAATDELVRAFAVVGRHGGLMVVHLRSQADAWLVALDEAIRIARDANVHLHVSHLCALGARNWPLVPQALDRLADARASGLPVTFDQHPYTGASTTLSQVLPLWVTEGGVAPMVERLASHDVRARVKAELAGRGRLGWENYAGLAGWDNVQIGGARQPENTAMIGRTVGELATERGEDPLDLVADLLIAEAGAVPMVLLGMYDDASIAAILAAPGGSVGTDGVIAQHPHPRLYGSTARVLGYYARDLGALTVAEAAVRLGPAGAAILGLRDRGTIAVGSAADVVVFDPATIEDRATYADPRQHPKGIDHVLVNGRFVVRDGRETGDRPGRVIRPER